MNSANLDSFDLKILREIRDNGRISMSELSDKIGLSPTPISRRIKNLEDSDIIMGYGAHINEAALGYDVSVFVSVKLDKQVDNALVSFETAIEAFPEVVECWLMTGNRDYLMRIATTGLKEFEEFLVGKLTKVSGVSSIESSIPLRCVKSGLARTN